MHRACKACCLLQVCSFASKAAHYDSATVASKHLCAVTQLQSPFSTKWSSTFVFIFKYTLKLKKRTCKVAITGNQHCHNWQATLKYVRCHLIVLTLLHHDIAAMSFFFHLFALCSDLHDWNVYQVSSFATLKICVWTILVITLVSVKAN